MPAAPAIIGGLGVAGSLYSSSRQRSAGRDAARQQQAAQEAQMGMLRENQDFAQQQYNDWRNLFMPVAQDLQSMAYEQREPDYAAIGADVGAAFDTSQAINRRQQQRFGLQPSDGAVADGELRYGLGRASAMVNARNQARTANQDQQFNRMMQFYGMGQGMGQNAAGMVSAANAGIASAFGGQANQYGQQAQMYRGQASSGMQDAMGWAGWGVDQMGWGGGG